MPEKSCEVWKVRASPIPAIQLGFMPVITRSPRRMSPASGWFRPQMTLRSVVLPAPLGPMMPTISPAPKAAEMSSSARTPPNEIDTLSTARMLMPAPPPRRSSEVAPLNDPLSADALGSAWPARCSGSCQPGSQRFRNTTSPFGWNTMKPTSKAPKTISWVDLNSRRSSMT